MRWKLVLAVSLVAFSSLAFTFGGAGSPFATDEELTPDNLNEIDTALDNLEAGTSIAASLTRDSEWDTVGEVETAWGSVNIILGTEIDTAAEINTLTTDTDMVLDTDIGSTVQAYNANLADLADGSLSGSKIGSGLDGTTITAGTVADARVASTITRDTEWDTTIEINAATIDDDFLTSSGSYNIATTGTIQGATSVTTYASSTQTLLSTTVLGQLYYYTSGSGVDVTLPAVAAGYSACFYDANGGGVVTLDAAAGDQIVLDGVGVGTAEAIDSAGALGDFICLLGVNDSTWINLGRSGTWVDGGAD